MKKDRFKEAKEVIDKIWPPAKKELEKALVTAKKMLDMGEKYIREVSEKSVKNTKKLSFTLQKDKLYFDLGKVIAKTSPAKRSKSAKIDKLMKGIKKLDRKIKKLK